MSKEPQKTKIPAGNAHEQCETSQVVDKVRSELSETDELKEKIYTAIKTVYDPELPVDVFELGLIYDVKIDMDTMHVKIDMTLTSPGCPVAQSLPLMVQYAAESIKGVKSVEVEVVWEPRWNIDMMSDVAKLQLGIM